MPPETTFAVAGDIAWDEVVEAWTDPGYPLALEPRKRQGVGSAARAYRFHGTGYHYSIESHSLAVCCRLQSGRIVKRSFRLRPHREPLFTDVFASDFTFPEKVCVLALGPNGEAHFARIPADACVFALNKAVLIRQVVADVWVCNQLTKECLAWYPQADQAFRGVRLYRRSAAIPKLTRLIAHIRRQGVDVYSLSPTKLTVPIR